MNENMKRKNQAPKEMEGTYIFTVKGNSVTFETNKGETIKVRCHPEDEFDISEAIKVALNKAEIKIGDIIRIVNPGQSYVTSYELFDPMQINHFHYATHFRYGIAPRLNAIGKVVDILEHNVYVIEVKGEYCFDEVKNEHYLNDYIYKDFFYDDTIYLMAEEGIERV